MVIRERGKRGLVVTELVKGDTVSRLTMPLFSNHPIALSLNTCTKKVKSPYLILSSRHAASSPFVWMSLIVKRPHLSLLLCHVVFFVPILTLFFSRLQNYGKWKDKGNLFDCSIKLETLGITWHLAECRGNGQKKGCWWSFFSDCPMLTSEIFSYQISEGDWRDENSQKMTSLLTRSFSDVTYFGKWRHMLVMTCAMRDPPPKKKCLLNVWRLSNMDIHVFNIVCLSVVLNLVTCLKLSRVTLVWLQHQHLPLVASVQIIRSCWPT